MAELPNVDYEIDLLNAFIAAVERPDAPVDDMLEGAQDQAYAYRIRLETPVRIAFAGFPGSGKSSLVNLLIGQDLLPSGRRNFSTPAIIVRHSATEKTIAGWWDRANQEIDGINLQAAFDLNPDLVSVEIDCDVLKDLWLIDISGLGDKENGKRAVFALMRLADVLLWCSSIQGPVTEPEKEAWRSVPGRLLRNSLLVQTHPDLASKAAESHVNPDRAKNFNDVIAVTPAAAMQAMRGEGADPERDWQESGADQLVNAVMIAAVEARQAELEKARRGIDKTIVPALAKLDAFFGTKTVIQPRPAPTPPLIPEAKSPPPAPPKPAEPAPVVDSPDITAAAVSIEKTPDTAAIWPLWLEKTQDILANAQSGALSDNAEFIETVQQAVDEFRDYIADSDALPADASWLIDEFEKANDLLILLQFETANDVAIDAARVLVQLSESLHSAGV
ncbi:MAG: dynamin family protein [Albidovulum sp.]